MLVPVEGDFVWEGVAFETCTGGHDAAGDIGEDKVFEGDVCLAILRDDKEQDIARELSVSEAKFEAPIFLF